MSSQMKTTIIIMLLIVTKHFSATCQIFSQKQVGDHVFLLIPFFSSWKGIIKFYVVAIRGHDAKEENAIYWWTTNNKIGKQCWRIGNQCWLKEKKKSHVYIVFVSLKVRIGWLIDFLDWNFLYSTIFYYFYFKT